MLDKQELTANHNLLIQTFSMKFLSTRSISHVTVAGGAQRH
jgi:hypothetical protein